MRNYKTNKKIYECAINKAVKEYKASVCKLIKEGSNLYQEGMLFDFQSDYYRFWKESSNEKLSEDERNIFHINFILSSMPKNEAEIIWNEFFFPQEKFYWMKKYNRSTYYRLRAKAINNFVDLLN